MAATLAANATPSAEDHPVYATAPRCTSLVPEFLTAVAQGGLKHPPRRRCRSSKIWFDSQPVVHGNPKLLLASEVALCRLDGNVAEQELDLVEFAAREVAQTRTGSSKIVRRQLVDAGASRRRANDVP